MEQIRSLSSQTLSEALDKRLVAATIEMSQFWDTMATDIFSVKDIAKEYVNDLIYGNQQLRDVNKQITNTQFELSIMYRDQINAQNKLNTLRRKDYESNDQYLQRVQFMSEIQAQQIDVYTFQTKEMETLKKINELELQRNQLIFDRLRALGQKITDKILDFGLNMLVGGLFGGGSTPTSGGGNTGGGGGSLFGGAEFPPPPLGPEEVAVE